MSEKEYIEREKLIRHLDDEIAGCKIPAGSRANGKGIAYGTELGLKMAKSYAETLPAADVVEVVYGEWVWNPDGLDWGIGAWECSRCICKNDNLGFDRNINPYRFAGSKWCPNCGAKMVKRVDQNG